MKQRLQTVDVIQFILRSWIFIRTVLFALVYLGGASALSFTSLSWLVFPVLALFIFLLFKYQFQIFPVSQVIEKVYNQYYHDKTLKDLKDRPLMAIASSNLHTGRPFTFSGIKMSDSTYSNPKEYDPPIRFRHEDFPVARAVMASSCVPFAFTPVLIDKVFFAAAKEYYRIKPVLVDGGVYDNQWIHKITQPGRSFECDIIITSDEGGSFLGYHGYPNAIALLTRTVDLFMYRIKAVQMVQNIYENLRRASKLIAYFSLGWRLDEIIPGFFTNMCAGQVLKEVIDAHGFEKQWAEKPAAFEREIKNQLADKVNYEQIKARELTEEEWGLACKTGTNLTALSQKRIDSLIRQA